jgi:hypothetical protein
MLRNTIASTRTITVIIGITLLHQPERYPQVQEPLRPGFECEAHDPLLVEVVDDFLEDHTRELLPVFVRAFIPQRHDDVQHLHTHAQLNGRLLCIRGT